MQRNQWKAIAVAAVTALGPVTAAFGSGVTGTYSSTSGTMLLELESGGKASFTMMGETKDCAYTVNGKIIQLTCGGGDDFGFRIMGDGSLTSTSQFAAATFGVLKKSK
jgi:hypothetical protein